MGKFSYERIGSDFFYEKKKQENWSDLAEEKRNTLYRLFIKTHQLELFSAATQPSLQPVLEAII